MPYITHTNRPTIDTAVTALAAVIKSTPGRAGATNYAVTRLVNMVFDGQDYQSVNDILGVLQAVQLEMYRRRAVPYENQKQYDNGDVPEYNGTPC